ncbi:3-phosphoserine/phosphohydroxythreonine transaminase [Anaeroselena agilis]|uniref:Phosphoserine aminotransferase n=1 Tax=Anaeroselena agilis TaxID=3063788 RepID=A0ABU3P2G5_9FIRM|nr:3-phosphoserine/phosphohydroxythreonine transaminase [Selenomonadales bacterium 4137-cl]
MNRAYNFNAGPSALPLPVLQKAQAELVDFRGTGMSIMEMSHRGKDYEAVHNEAVSLLRELMAIPADYDILFLQGGASLQFAMVPMNFLPSGRKAGYILTGSWAEKAYAEAKQFGEVFEAAGTKSENYRRVPAAGDLSYAPDSAYIHLTSNNTIFGTEWHAFPDTGAVPLIADMSSDILARPVEVSKFALIYAGAQKNLGPAGVTVAIVRRGLLEQANAGVPTMLRYATHAKDNSLYNTPPTFGIYLVGLVLAWIKEQGGVDAIHKRNKDKAGLIYDAIDKSGGFYRGHAQQDSRSLMNITFRLGSEDLEKKFLDEAKKAGFVGLAGHRSVGGCRASAYNAVPVEACRALAQFMIDFQKSNG